MHQPASESVALASVCTALRTISREMTSRSCIVKSGFPHCILSGRHIGFIPASLILPGVHVNADDQGRSSSRIVSRTAELVNSRVYSEPKLPCSKQQGTFPGDDGQEYFCSCQDGNAGSKELADTQEPAEDKHCQWLLWQQEKGKQRQFAQKLISAISRCSCPRCCLDCLHHSGRRSHEHPRRAAGGYHHRQCVRVQVSILSLPLGSQRQTAWRVQSIAQGLQPLHAAWQPLAAGSVHAMWQADREAAQWLLSCTACLLGWQATACGGAAVEAAKGLPVPGGCHGAGKEKRMEEKKGSEPTCVGGGVTKRRQDSLCMHR